MLFHSTCSPQSKARLFSATSAVVWLGLAMSVMPQFARAESSVAEVVVTAQKRQENIQEVPASITAQKGEVLAARNMVQLTDYAINVPGLNVSNLGKAGLTAINMRGIASVSTGASVAAYIDETPIGSSGLFNYGANTILDMLPYDLDRIEVLRGPQGTLYGAGALGGLIKYVLKPAQLGSHAAGLGADAEATDGSGRTGYTVRGFVNLPISDQLAVRVSAYDRDQPGYIDRVWASKTTIDVNSEKQRGGRLAIFWQPAPNLTVKGDVYRTEIDAADGGVVSYGGLTSVATSGAKIVTLSRPFGDLTENHAFPQLLKKDITLYAATVNWDSARMSVTSATSYSQQAVKISADQSLAVRPFGFLFGVPNALARSDTHLSVDKFTQELRMASKPSSQPVSWTLGGFYTDERAEQGDPSKGDGVRLFRPDFSLAPGLNPFLTTQLSTTYKEYALFGDATWDITDQFDLSAGVRYASNRQSWTQVSGGVFAGPSAGKVSVPSNTEAVTTWSASARYRPSSDLMVYGRIATGYRPGGPNAPTPAAPRYVNSDSLVNYELGLKSTWLNDRVMFDATLFAVDWKDVQLNAVRGGYSYLANGGDAKSSGLELSTSWVPADGLVLSANLAYTKSELKSVIAESNFVKGYQLPGVPKLAGSLNADYAWAPTSGWTAAVGGNWRYVGKQWMTGVQVGPSAAPTVEAPSYQLVNLYASATHNAVKYKLFVNNLANETAQQGGIALIDLGNNPVQGDVYVAKPRTVGLGIDISFN